MNDGLIFISFLNPFIYLFILDPGVVGTVSLASSCFTEDEREAGSWVCSLVGSSVRGFVGSWVRDFVVSWVLGFVGSWVRGFVSFLFHLKCDEVLTGARFFFSFLFFDEI